MMTLKAQIYTYIYDFYTFFILFLFQADEESKLRTRVSGLDQELVSEKSRTAELEKALEQSQENLTKLQSDFYGKESEVSAIRQDLKVQKS